jgi:predicted transcriptional regulator
MPITLSPEIEERIQKAAALRGLDANTYAVSLLTASLEDDHEEFKDACRGIAAGIADMEAGRTVSFEEYRAERRAAREARRRRTEASPDGRDAA